MTRPSERGLYRRYILGGSATRNLADALAQTPGETIVKRRWGIVTAINAEDDTVDVDLAGVVVPHVRRSAYYSPTVGERVWLDVVGTDVVVVSPTAPSVANDYITLDEVPVPPQPGLVSLGVGTTTPTANSIVFSNIPQTYNHLLVIGLGSASVTGTTILFAEFNGDASVVYDGAVTYTYASDVSDYTVFNDRGAAPIGHWQNDHNTLRAEIPFYRYTDIYKTVQYQVGGRGIGGDFLIGSGSTIWPNAAGITQVRFLLAGNVNFRSHTRFQLYGMM